MAVVQCEHCLVSYDDTFRLTECPHDGFDMVTLVVRGDGQSRICRSLTELATFVGERGASAITALPESDGADCGRV